MALVALLVRVLVFMAKMASVARVCGVTAPPVVVVVGLAGLAALDLRARGWFASAVFLGVHVLVVEIVRRWDGACGRL